uniref:(northern house mosquito) hypothetical protein n=2 Tax=Culex pipiens TaxID=7175 RepID=A0A8D8JMG1_CULPI
MPWELGVPGAAEAPPVPPPLELSLLFWPVESCERLGTTIALMSQGFSTAASGANTTCSRCTTPHSSSYRVARTRQHRIFLGRNSFDVMTSLRTFLLLLFWSTDLHTALSHLNTLFSSLGVVASARVLHPNLGVQISFLRS